MDQLAAQVQRGTNNPVRIDAEIGRSGSAFVADHGTLHLDIDSHHLLDRTMYIEWTLQRTQHLTGKSDQQCPIFDLQRFMRVEQCFGLRQDVLDLGTDGWPILLDLLHAYTRDIA